MSEKVTVIAIDRLSGGPFAEPLDRTWTVAEIKEAAGSMGKPFNPVPEIRERLGEDLANGALVLFTQDEVGQAIEMELIPEVWRNDLKQLVETNNDIAIIPSGTVKAWQDQQRLYSQLTRR